MSLEKVSKNDIDLMQTLSAFIIGLYAQDSTLQTAQSNIKT